MKKTNSRVSTLCAMYRFTNSSTDQAIMLCSVDKTNSFLVPFLHVQVQYVHIIHTSEGRREN